MTRDEAKALVGRTALLMFEHNGSSILDGDKTLHIIDKIFDEHGEHLMDRDDEIELLKHRVEEAMKPKTCEGCKWEQETKLITTKVGDKVDICKLCTRYENLQDHYEKKVTT